MNTKRVLAFVCTMGLAAAMLSGCGTTGGTASKTESTAASTASASEGEAKSSSGIKTVDDLKGKKIAVQLGTTGAIYAKDVEGADVQEFNKGADAVMAVVQGKADCVIIDEQPAKVFVKQNDSLMILDEDFTEEEYAAVIKKDNTDLLDKVNAALGELKKDGTLDKIIATYIPEDGAAASDYHYVQTVKSDETLVMATNAAFPPYEYYEAAEIVGIDVEIGRAIADKLGKTLKVEDMEFDSIINAVSSGKADIGLAGFTVTEDRKKQINFSDSYASSTQVIIVKK